MTFQASTPIYLPESAARAVLELYATAYSEGLAPDSADELIGWIASTYPGLFQESEFSYLPRPE